MHSFGSSVDIDGDTVVVGAPDSRETSGDVDGPGFVFAYWFSGGVWTLTDWMTSDAGDPWQFFGASIDLENWWLIVGAPKEGSEPDQYGAAFLFEWDGWDMNQIADIHPIETPDPFYDDDFGVHVANDNGAYMIIAADEYAAIVEEDSEDPGSWVGQAVLLPGRHTDRWTDGVDFDGAIAMYVDSANDEVAVIQWVSGVWQERYTLSTATTSTEPFGVAVSHNPLGPERAAVGYPYEDAAGRDTGVIATYHETSTMVLEDERTVGDAQEGDWFGHSVAATQTNGADATAIVAAPLDQRGGLTGAAYVYTYEAVEHEWTKSERWSPDELYPGAGFGYAVACTPEGGLAATAQMDVFDEVIRGSVYVRHEGGLDEQIIGPQGGEFFGRSVAYQGDWLVVGASSGDAYQPDTGVVYTYAYDGVGGWTEGQRISRTDSSNLAEFGASLTMDGNRMLVGAPEQGTGDDRGGAVYVYELGTTWSFVDTLEPDAVHLADGFGTALVLAGDVAFVGAPGDDSAAPDVGSVHLFERIDGAWTWVAEFAATDAESGDAFGASIALVGDDLFIGAPGVDVGGAADAGATYSYRRFGDLWVPGTERIVHESPVEEDQCGAALAFVSDMLLSGAIGEDGAAYNAGAVIVTDYDAHVEVPSPMAPGPGGQPCSYEFDLLFDQRFDSPVDPTANSYYAEHVDVSGDTMVITEPSAYHVYIDPQGQPQNRLIGAVHIYRRTAVDNWTLEQTLFPPAIHLYPHPVVSVFGTTVAIDGDWLLVGHWYGRFVYVYQRTRAGWVMRDPITAPTDPTSAFGVQDLDISGNTAMISDAILSGTNGSYLGAVFFFELVSGAWELTTGPLWASPCDPHMRLGWHVAVDDASGWAVATSRPWTAGFRDAYAFRRLPDGTWEQDAKLEGEPHGASGHFGLWDVAISGSTIVVGDPYYWNPPSGSNSGAAFVWEHDGGVWTGPELLHGDETVVQEGVSRGVAIDGDVLVLGAPGAYTQLPGGDRTGVLHVFARESGVWTRRLRIQPPDLDLGIFGQSVAVDGGIVVGGTPAGSRFATMAWDGVAYAFDIGCAWPCPGDFNDDGQRDLIDFAIFQRNFGLSGATVSDGDANEDGVVDLIDLQILVDSFGVPCP